MPEPNKAATADSSWRRELTTAIRSSRQLCRTLGLEGNGSLDADDENPFPVLVPQGFVQRMRHGDPHDPLLRQVLGVRDERIVAAGYGADPLEESRFASAGVLRKYAGRALLITTGACPIHCRYCFRRHYPYSEQLAARARWSGALALLREDTQIEEVILSGGDPLTLATERLAELVNLLQTVDSLETLRIHTRFPVVIPARVTAGLVDLLRASRLRTVVVVHANHANELRAADVEDALGRLRDGADLLLNQTVLLSGVNDSVTALRELSGALFAAGVLPYYLHMLDPVAGSAHFEVTDERALELIAGLRSELPGYLVPRLVREVPGALSKTPLN